MDFSRLPTASKLNIFFHSLNLYIIVSLLQQDVDLLEERVTPRKNLPPLLMKLSERKPEKLDYLGVSYGLTSGLLK